MSVPAVQWRKEVRELLPWWGAMAVTILVCWALMQPHLVPGLRNFLLGVGLIAYATGALILGSISIGNEYSHDTLTQLLVHPAARGQVLRVKLTVLALMLAALGALASAAWVSEPAWAGIAGDSGRLVLIILPLACGLLLAPGLTMVGRSSLGGAAFTAVLPAILWVTSIYVRLPTPLIWTAAAVVAVVAPVMTWRTFMRLEVTGTSQSDVDLSAWFSRSGDVVRSARTQSPVWLLFKKELRLQQATLVVSGLYILIWLTMVADRLLGLHALTNSPMFVATFVNTALVPLLCGALASAGERQLGVSDWQTLLPIGAWKQWAIKTGVALGMAFALAVVLPTFLASIAFETGWREGMEPTTVMMFCAAALYVSSLSNNGLRALLVTVPAIAVAIAAVSGPIWLIDKTAQPVLRSLAQVLPFVEVTRADYSWWMRYGSAWLAAGFFLLLLAFGNANHRTADRSRPRVVKQFAWLSAYALACLLFLSLIGHLLQVFLNQSRGH